MIFFHCPGVQSSSLSNWNYSEHFRTILPFSYLNENQRFKKKIQATRNVPTQSFLFFFFIFNKYIVKITAVETVKSNKKKTSQCGSLAQWFTVYNQVIQYIFPFVDYCSYITLLTELSSLFCNVLHCLRPQWSLEDTQRSCGLVFRCDCAAEAVVCQVSLSPAAQCSLQKPSSITQSEKILVDSYK